MHIVYKDYLVSKKQNLWFSTESVESITQPSPLGSWSGAIHSVGVHEEQTQTRLVGSELQGKFWERGSKLSPGHLAVRL